MKAKVIRTEISRDGIIHLADHDLPPGRVNVIILYDDTKSPELSLDAKDLPQMQKIYRSAGTRLAGLRLKISDAKQYTKKTNEQAGISRYQHPRLFFTRPLAQDHSL